MKYHEPQVFGRTKDPKTWVMPCTLQETPGLGQFNLLVQKSGWDGVFLLLLKQEDRLIRSCVFRASSGAARPQPDSCPATL